MCGSRAKLDPSPHSSPCTHTAALDSLSASSLPCHGLCVLSPAGRAGRGQVSYSPHGLVGSFQLQSWVEWVPPPSAAGGEGGGDLCLAAGCSRGDPAVTAQCLCSIQAVSSPLAVPVLSAGKPQERELSRGVQLRQTLVFLLSCWELPPLSFLSSETKVTESPGRCLCCGLSPRVGELCKLQNSLWQWS